MSVRQRFKTAWSVTFFIEKFQVPNLRDQKGKNATKRRLSHPVCGHNLTTNPWMISHICNLPYRVIFRWLKTRLVGDGLLQRFDWQLTAGIRTHFEFLSDIVSVETWSVPASQGKKKVRYLFTETVSEETLLSSFLCFVHTCYALPSLTSSFSPPDEPLPPTTKHLPLSRAGVGGSHRLIRQSKQSLSHHW